MPPLGLHEEAVDANEMVVLVDDEDRQIGVAEKLACHRRGYLHRAVSINLTDPSGNILLQQRADGKYHSGGLWSNACCTHPRPGESAICAAERRLLEEMGIVCILQFSRSLQYCADVGGGLTENELVHLFVGIFRGSTRPNPTEVRSYRWISRSELDELLRIEPERFSPWFRHYVAVGAI